MKKIFVLAILALLSLNSFAMTKTRVCEQEARKAIAQGGFDTEYPANKKLGARFDIGDTYTAYNQQIGPFSEEKIVYVLQGDEMGWFEVAAVMNPETCELEGEIVALYIE